MTIYTIKKLDWRENQIADNDPSWRAAGIRFIDYLIIELKSGEYCLYINVHNKENYSTLENAKDAAKDHLKTEMEKNLIKTKPKPHIYKGFLEEKKSDLDVSIDKWSIDIEKESFLNRVFDIINDKNPELIAEVIAQIEQDDREKENESTQKWLNEGLY